MQYVKAAQQRLTLFCCDRLDKH